MGGGGDGGELLPCRTTLLVNARQGRSHVCVARQAFLHQHIAVFHRGNGVAGFLLDALDHSGDFVGGLASARRQVAHFVSNHCKPTALLTGTRCLDRGVQRQQIGLLGDGSNHTDDPADFLGALAQGVDHRSGAIERRGDVLQRRRRLLHRRAADTGLLGVFLCQAFGVAHVVGDIQRGGAELLHCAGHAGDFTRLLLHAFIRTTGQPGQRLCPAVDLFGRLANMRDHGRQRLTHLVEAARQLADFIMAGHIQTYAQVARAQGLGLTHQVAQGLQFAAQ